MAGLDVDTSSYPKPQQTNPMDMVQKLNAVRQQNVDYQRSGVALNDDKLNLVNKQYNYLINGLASLPKNATTQDYLKMGQHMVDMGIAPPEMYSRFVPQVLQNQGNLPAFQQRLLQQLSTTHEKILGTYGEPGFMDTGNAIYPTQRSSYGGAPIPVGPGPIAKTPSPEFSQSGYTYKDENGNLKTIQQGSIPARTGGAIPPRQNLYGSDNAPAPSMGNPPVAPPPQQAPADNINLPAVHVPGQGNPPAAGVWGPDPRTAPKFQVSQQMPPKPGMGSMEGPSGMLDKGQEKYTSDTAKASSLATGVNRLTQALPKIKQLLISGVGSDSLNQLGSILNQFGMTGKIATQAEGYQEVNKLLAQYLRARGATGSDLDRINAADASGNAKTQIKPALLSIVKDSIANDRAEILLPGAYPKDQPTDKRYLDHASTFPGTVSKEALQLDLMDSTEKAELLKKMDKNRNTPEGQKFFNTLKLARDNPAVYGKPQ